MFLFISILFSIKVAVLWTLLIASKKAKSDEEKFLEDNLQMEYLKEYSLKKNKI